MTTNNFTFFSMFKRDHCTHETCTVTVLVNAKYWTKLRDKGQLGMLYGVDISNWIYRTYDIPARNPTVDHSRRAKNGMKRIELSYTYEIKQPTKLLILKGGAA